ncbi:MAG: dTMP kinase [Burkholderiaceae bacterium]
MSLFGSSPPPSASQSAESGAAGPKFLVLEGIDGAGKSTHLQFLANHLRESGQSVLITREPGGSPLAETLREIVLHSPMDGLTELLIIFAARRDHLRQTIWPALERGQWVISDRFTDSTRAYQGTARGLPSSLIEAMAQAVEAEGRGPDHVFYFDLPAEVAAKRRRDRSAGALLAEEADRFDTETIAFFERVRLGYRLAAQNRQDRQTWIDAQRSVEAIQQDLAQVMHSWLSFNAQLSGTAAP